ncbi:hypothetical protein SAMN02745166_01103 [Prosthecobacter debontii]|uniref:Uncharacterized protein n=1 Tax=Prosthecobacter debontii TaxID=48467 RepID=A0A1T4X674_9BACT|nr:hypothetical protein SAMN02745166_01103 [Prosthecobacter debontii]
MFWQIWPSRTEERGTSMPRIGVKYQMAQSKDFVAIGLEGTSLEALTCLALFLKPDSTSPCFALVLTLR